MGKKIISPTAPSALGTQNEQKRGDALHAVYHDTGFELPRTGAWGSIGGYFLAGIIGACAAAVMLLMFASDMLSAVPLLNRINIAALLSPATPVTIARTERITVTAEDRNVEITKRIAPSLFGVYTQHDLTEDIEGLVQSSAAPRAHAVALTSDGWLVSMGDLDEARAGDLMVFSTDGKAYPVQKRIEDRATGVWLLKIDAATLVAVPLRKEPISYVSGMPALLFAFRVGASPLAIPLAIMGTVTLPLRDVDKLETRLRLSGPVSDMGIGMPVMTMAGDMIGLVSGLNGGAYAVPMMSVAGIFSNAFEKGAMVRASVGVQYLELSTVADLGFALSHGRRQGALLVKYGNKPAVASKSFGEAAGLKEGDIIVKVENELVREESDFATLLHSYPLPTTVKLTVLRDGEEKFMDLLLSPPLVKK